MRLHVIPIAAAVPFFHDVPRRGQLGDDAVGAASVIPHHGGDVAWRRTPGSWAMQTRTRAWLVRKLHSAIGIEHSLKNLVKDC